MAVYSYYYGASVERGINIQAQSKELETLPIRAVLKDLASMHALDSSDHSGEMLSYLLSSSGYSVLGTSYIESPKSSGYNRSAPCGLMYVASDDDMGAMAERLGRIVNFVNFQKPNTAAPAAKDGFPLNESGYSFHNGTAILMPLVDGLVRVALSSAKEVLLVALPRGKSSDYATARYTIAEALGYLPAWMRSNIRFFTGLPVAESETDALKGFDNAVKFGANVIFCPNEFFARLKSHRSCIALDMEHPSAQVNAFAKYIANAADVSASLTLVNSCLSGADSYDALNAAAQQVQRGEIMTMDVLQKQLIEATTENRKLQKAMADYERYAEQFQVEHNSLKARYTELETVKRQLDSENKRLQKENRRLEQMQRGGGAFQNYQPEAEEEEEESRSSKVLYWILNLLGALLLMAITFVGTMFVTEILNKDDKEALPAPAAIVENTAVPGAMDEVLDENQLVNMQSEDEDADQVTGQDAENQGEAEGGAPSDEFNFEDDITMPGGGNG